MAQLLVAANTRRVVCVLGAVPTDQLVIPVVAEGRVPEERAASRHQIADRIVCVCLIPC